MAEDIPTLKVGVPKETFPGEQRVALVPSVIGSLTNAGLAVLLESGAGTAAGFSNRDYADQGVQIVDQRAELFSQADVILQVRLGGANPNAGRADLESLHEGQTLIGQCEPLSEPQWMRDLAAQKVTSFSLELLPRITRAQSMDVLSSMATIAGYKSVLLAANALPRMFPMMMTAAGTLTPARVLIVGAGVAGLQAIATARRLGANVQAYDIRPAVKEEVQSLGAKFVELELATGESGESGGYAKEMDEEFYRKQRELLARVIAQCDVVITTAAVPGKTAPVLVTKEMVAGMPSGSVLVDVAAERGGNCELTQPGETVHVDGVTILGPDNLPSTIPDHASRMYAKNITTFLLHLIKNGALELDLEEEIVAGTLVAHRGALMHPQVCELLGVSPETPTKERETLPLSNFDDEDTGHESPSEGDEPT